MYASSHNPVGSRQSHLDALQKMGIAPFLKALYTILCTESSSIVGWTRDGTAFEVRDLKALSGEVLPKYFRHGKFSSFQRQLNYFGFKKLTKSHANVCTYVREHFVRDNPAGMFLIKRKTNGSRMRLNSMESNHESNSPHLHEQQQQQHAMYMQQQQTGPLKLHSIMPPYDYGLSTSWEPHRFMTTHQTHHEQPETSEHHSYQNMYQSSSFLPLQDHHHHASYPLKTASGNDHWVLNKPTSGHDGGDIKYEYDSNAENLSNNDLVALRDAVSILCGDSPIYEEESTPMSHQLSA